MDFQARRDRLRKAFKKAGVDALLVTDFTNVTYLTGFTGDDSYLLVRRDGETVLSDPRYMTQLGEECPGVDLFIRPPGATMLQAVVRVVRAARIGRLGIEGDSMTVGLRDRIVEKLPKVEIVATSGLVEKLRLVKDKDEIARLRVAVRQAEKAFAVLRSHLAAGDDREGGGRRVGTPVPAVRGQRRGLSHASWRWVRGRRCPMPRPAAGGGSARTSFVLVDWGANEGLYRSDLTRVLVTGRISAKFERIYKVVLEAQVRAIAAVRPGVLAHDVDHVARAFIAKAGFGRRFRHGLGHGLGLLVHEAPRLAVKSQTILRPGMVVTVEPGIYLPGWGGVRIEDDVLVTRTGQEVLTHVPKRLEEVVVG